MFKSLYSVNYPYIEHLLISIQTLHFQPQFSMQTLILSLGGDLCINITSFIYVPAQRLKRMFFLPFEIAWRMDVFEDKNK